jgi:hypothetical protein
MPQFCLFCAIGGGWRMWGGGVDMIFISTIDQTNQKY